MNKSEHLLDLMEYVKADRDLLYAALRTDRSVSPGHAKRLEGRIHKLNDIIDALFEYSDLQA